MGLCFKYTANESLLAMLKSPIYIFEFRFYTSENKKLNYNQPDLDINDTELFNLSQDTPTCRRIKHKEFDYQYSYYLSVREDQDKTVGIFSVYLSPDVNFNVSYSGAIGIFMRKLLVIHFPHALIDSIVRIYLPNYATPITRVVKAQFRLDCIDDFVLSLKDGYSIELL